DLHLRDADAALGARGHAAHGPEDAHGDEAAPVGALPGPRALAVAAVPVHGARGRRVRQAAAHERGDAQGHGDRADHLDGSPPSMPEPKDGSYQISAARTGGPARLAYGTRRGSRLACRPCAVSSCATIASRRLITCRGSRPRTSAAGFMATATTSRSRSRATSTRTWAGSWTSPRSTAWSIPSSSSSITGSSTRSRASP